MVSLPVEWDLTTELVLLSRPERNPSATKFIDYCAARSAKAEMSFA
jgi:hypothetical protein